MSYSQIQKLLRASFEVFLINSKPAFNPYNLSTKRTQTFSGNSTFCRNSFASWGDESPRIFKTFWRCRCNVRQLMFKCSAMALLSNPSAKSCSTCFCRWVGICSRVGGSSGVNESEPPAGNEEGQQQYVQLQQHAGAVDIHDGCRRQSLNATGAVRPDTEGLWHGTTQQPWIRALHQTQAQGATPDSVTSTYKSR